MGRGRGARRRRLMAGAGRRTNLALLWMTVGAFGTGWVAFALAQPTSARLAMAAHGLLGLGVIALAPWKAMVVRRAARRAPLRLASLVLLALVVVGLVAGFVQLFAGWRTALGVSPIQVHVGAAVIVVPLLAWHVLRHRHQPFRRSDRSRRVLLRGAGLAAVLGGGFLLLDAVARWSGGAQRRPAATGSRAVDPDAIPGTIWLLDEVPILPADRPVLIDGRPYSAAQLADGADPVAARLDCTSGWYADATWTGRRLAELLPDAALAGAASIVVRSATGYVRRFPATDAADLWLVVGCQGRPLDAISGAPIRLVAPGRRGFWWVKWVVEVRLSDVPSWRQPPFPLS